MAKKKISTKVSGTADAASAVAFTAAHDYGEEVDAVLAAIGSSIGGSVGLWELLARAGVILERVGRRCWDVEGCYVQAVEAMAANVLDQCLLKQREPSDSDLIEIAHMAIDEACE